MKKLGSEEIRKVLKEFQDGYIDRDKDKADMFLTRLFKADENAYILGTSTSEFDFGYKDMKTLFSDDWEYWGDVRLDYGNAKIDVYGNTAFISMFGYVEIEFDYEEENDCSFETITDVIKKSDITSRQKIAFINWLLSLDYRTGGEKKASSIYPLRLSGVLVNGGGWKFVQLHYSIPKSDYPDECFEHDREFKDNFSKQMEKLESKKCGIENEKIKKLITNFEDELAGSRLSAEDIENYFVTDGSCYVIAPDNRQYDGKEQIIEALSSLSKMKLSLDFEHAVFRTNEEASWVTLCGTVKQTESEEDFFKEALLELEGISKEKLSIDEKLSKIQRSAAYALKEAASGEERTYPIRVTATIVDIGEGPKFQSLHISYPYYWILYNKFDRL